MSVEEVAEGSLQFNALTFLHLLLQNPKGYLLRNDVLRNELVLEVLLLTGKRRGKE